MKPAAPERADAFAPGAPRISASFWLVAEASLLDELGTAEVGLSSPEAASRLRRFGPNLAVAAPERHWAWRIARRLAEPLVAILLVAAAISAATGEWSSSAIIMVIVVLSVGLDVFQEHRADAAATALKRSVAIRADVRRDGRTLSLAVEDLVPGDVVRLKAGDLVPQTASLASRERTPTRPC